MASVKSNSCIMNTDSIGASENSIIPLSMFSSLAKSLGNILIGFSSKDPGGEFKVSI